MKRGSETKKTIVVEGAFPFPVDMLRYDSAWPASESDSHLIRSTINAESEGKMRVELHTHSKYAPTAGRWESFGWKVLEVK